MAWAAEDWREPAASRTGGSRGGAQLTGHLTTSDQGQTVRRIGESVRMVIGKPGDGFGLRLPGCDARRKDRARSAGCAAAGLILCP
jgi:hypothetical protein